MSVVTVEINQELFACIEEIKQERKFKTMDDTISYLIDSYHLSQALIQRINEAIKTTKTESSGSPSPIAGNSI